MALQHYPWPSIDSFSHVVRAARKWADAISYDGGTLVSYRGKIKLHGTNAGIVISNGVVQYAQKRSSALNWPHEDNFSFANWVMTKFKPVYDSLDTEFSGVLHGEWAGPGVQKGVALADIPNKIFAVFAAENHGEGAKWIIEPQEIEDAAGLDHPALDDLGSFHVLSWYTPVQVVDILARDQHLGVMTAQEFADSVNAVVEQVEKVDPFVKGLFGVDGTGEGLVYFPVHTNMTRVDCVLARLMFKAKGEEHRVVKSKGAATVAPLVDGNMVSLAEKLVPEPRLKQGVFEVFGNDPIDLKRMPEFLKWVGNDVLKECLQTILDNGYEWKKFSGCVTKIASKWLVTQAKAI